MNSSEKFGLLVLRVGLGVFLLLWGFDKLLATEQTIGIFSHFYKISVSSQLAYALGIAEIFLGLLICVGVWKRYSYGAGLLVHGVSTISTYAQLMSPFGQNHLFIAALPVLAGFIALYILREHDTLYSVDSMLTSDE